MSPIDVIDCITWVLFAVAAVVVLIGWALWRSERRRAPWPAGAHIVGTRIRLPGFRGVYTVVEVDERGHVLHVDRPMVRDGEGEGRTTEPNGGV